MKFLHLFCFRFIASQPEEVRQFFIFRKKRDVETEEDSEEPELTTFTPAVEDEQVDHVNNVNCTWTVKVVTFRICAVCA